MGKNIIIISILDKLRSVAPVKLEINLVSPKRQSYVILRPPHPPPLSVKTENK